MKTTQKTVLCLFASGALSITGAVFVAQDAANACGALRSSYYHDPFCNVQVAQARPQPRVRRVAQQSGVVSRVAPRNPHQQSWQSPALEYPTTPWVNPRIYYQNSSINREQLRRLINTAPGNSSNAMTSLLGSPLTHKGGIAEYPLDFDRGTRIRVHYRYEGGTPIYEGYSFSLGNDNEQRIYGENPWCNPVNPNQMGTLEYMAYNVSARPQDCHNRNDVRHRAWRAYRNWDAQRNW